MDITLINLWHERARPAPDQAAINAQFGAHLEEICEMLEAVTFVDPQASMEARETRAYESLKHFAAALKAQKVDVLIADRKGMLDSLCDQVVTAVGVGHCAGMKVPEGCERVNRSNWSKFVDGQPVFLEGGKIGKGPNYAEPDLSGLY